MTEKITEERANQLVFEQGGFLSLETLVRDFDLSLKSEGRHLRNFFSRLLGPQVNEALNEVTHIQRALIQLRNTCREGSHVPDRVNGGGQTPLIGRFQRDLWALDGWVVSLYETNLCLVGFVSPAMARQKVQQFGFSMNSLLARRESELSPFAKDPTLFEDYFK